MLHLRASRDLNVENSLHTIGINTLCPGKRSLLRKTHQMDWFIELGLRLPQLSCRISGFQSLRDCETPPISLSTKWGYDDLLHGTVLRVNELVYENLSTQHLGL